MNTPTPKKDQTHDILDQLFPEWKRTRAWFRKETGRCAWCGKTKDEHDGEGPYFCRKEDACGNCGGTGTVPYHWSISASSHGVGQVPCPFCQPKPYDYRKFAS